MHVPPTVIDALMGYYSCRPLANLIKVSVVHTDSCPRGRRDLQSDKFCNNSHIAQFPRRQHALYTKQFIFLYYAYVFFQKNHSPNEFGLLTRTQEDESNDILLNIVDLHIFCGQCGLRFFKTTLNLLIPQYALLYIFIFSI